MIELRRLRYLVTVGMRLSFSRAAEDLGITQSALTRAIQSLEAEMGMRLLDRDQSGVTLTEQGRRVMARAEALLIHAKDFEHQVTRTARGEEGRIRFGATRLTTRMLVPAALPPRLSQAPDFAHEVLVRQSDELYFLLTSRDVEFFVSEAWQPTEVLPIRAETLGEVSVALVVRGDHPLKTSADLRGYPLLIDWSAGQTSDLLLELRERTGAAIQAVEDFSALAELTRSTDAVWVTSPSALSEEIVQGRLRELIWPEAVPKLTLKVTMYSLERRSQSPALIELRNAFRRHLARVAPAPGGGVASLTAAPYAA